MKSSDAMKAAKLISEFEYLTRQLDKMDNKLHGPMTIKFEGARGGGSRWSILKDVDDEVYCSDIILLLGNMISRQRDNVVEQLKVLGVEPTDPEKVNQANRERQSYLAPRQKERSGLQ